MKIIKKIKGGLLLIFIFCAFITMIPNILLAQSKKNEDAFLKEFNQFKSEIQKEFNAFKSKNDSIFLQFLNSSWEEFNLFVDKRPDKPKPELQPVLDTLESQIIENIPAIIKLIENKTDDINEQPIKSPVIKQAISSIQKVPIKELYFYGTRLKIPYFPASLPYLKNTSRSGISSYFNKAAKSDELLFSVNEINKKANELKLNGWGTLKLIQIIANNFYEDANNQVLFTWFVLIKTGYKAKVAYVGNHLFLLCNFDVPLYNRSYCEIKNRKYYIILFKKQCEPQKKFFTYKKKHANQIKNLTLNLNKKPNLDSKIIKRKIAYKKQPIEIPMNKNLIDFYSTYPDCDLSIYLSTSLSSSSLAVLDTFFLPKFTTLNDHQKASILLDFVQNSIEYKNDKIQFGYENYLFAEETLFYPFADCEDRVALLAQLIRHYTNLECIGLDYPKHMSMAITIPDEITGSYLVYKNSNYYICDPTYIGAGIGMIMPRFRNIKPEIIDVN
jgi:hypothetical protein